MIFLAVSAAFSLGLERAGMETVAFCEIEEFPRKVLRKHWPEVPIFTDIKHLKFDASAKILYDDRYGQEKNGQTASNCDVSIGTISGRCGDLLRGHQAGNVGMAEGEGCENAPSVEVRKGQSFPQERQDGQRQGAEHAGNRDTAGDSQPQGGLREVFGNANIQGRAHRDSGASLRLQQAARCDVAVPEMPPRMAQEQQSNNEERRLNGIHAVKGTIDVICGGFP